MTSPPSIPLPTTRLESSATPHAHPGKVRRLKCPVHQGKNLSVAVGFTNGRAWAKCHSKGCASADILRALNITNPSTWSTSPLLRATRRSSPETLPADRAEIVPAPPLPPVTPAEADAYLAGILTERGATIEYQRNDGKRGKHWRNTTKRRNPNVTGDGWQVRRFNPERPGDALAICLCEGEKDAAILAAAGLISFTAPRGAQSLPSADLSELVATAKATELPVLLAGDHDDAGRDAMLRIRENLRKAGLNPLDTMIHAPLKGSIADLERKDLLALVDRLIAPHSSRWQKPVRNHRKYQEYRCPRPKHWQGPAGDRATVWNLRPCEKGATCPRCAAWELYLHVERAVRGNPAQLVDVAGFGTGNADATIPETVGLAKVYREHLVDRLRKTSGIHPYQENPTGEKRNFLTVLRIRDDYRAGLALILDQPLSEKELSRERARAERAGLTFTVIDHPGRADIEAIAPQALSIGMEGHGMTAKTHTWTTSGWPDWEDNPPTYAFSDGRYLEDHEEFDPGSITTAQWKKDNHQGWDNTLSLRANLERREDYALHNAQLWMSRCLGLNLETLQAIGNASGRQQVAELIAEVGDYDGPTALLRDAAAYLKTGKKWRKAYGPVLNAAGWAG